MPKPIPNDMDLISSEALSSIKRTDIKSYINSSYTSKGGIVSWLLK